MLGIGWKTFHVGGLMPTLYCCCDGSFYLFIVCIIVYPFPIMNISTSDLEIINNRKIMKMKVLLSNSLGCSGACEKDGWVSLSLSHIHSLFHYFCCLSSRLLLNHPGEPQKRGTGKSDSISTRLPSFDCYLNGEFVCRNRCAITPRRIQILQQKMKDDQLAPKDKRSTHLNRRHAIDVTVRGTFREHIESSPIENDHY